MNDGRPDSAPAPESSHPDSTHPHATPGGAMEFARGATANPPEPPPPMADPYAPYEASATATADASARASDLAERRSRWRIVFPVISLAIGVFGMCVQGVFSAQIVFWEPLMERAGMALSPPPDIIRSTVLAQIALIVPLGIMLIAGSAMLLLRKPLGAKLVLFWAVARLVLVVAGLVAAVVTIKPNIEWGVTLTAEIRDEMRKAGRPEKEFPPIPDVEKAERDGIRNMAFVSIATATWPFVMAIVLTRRHVREEIESWKPAQEPA
jgi:hypothetical protein